MTYENYIDSYSKYTACHTYDRNKNILINHLMMIKFFKDESNDIK